MFSVPTYSHFRFLILPLVILTPLSAQSSPESESGLSLASALQRVNRQSPSLTIQRYAAEAAAGQIDQAQLRPVPSLDVEMENFVGTGPHQGFDDTTITVQASQRIERGDKRLKRTALAEHELAITTDEFDVRRLEILTRTASAYVDTVAAGQQVELAHRAITLAQEMLTTIELQVRSGFSSPVDSARARAALATAEVERMRTESTLRAARANLLAQWGESPDATFTVNRTITLPPELPDVSVLRAQLAQHPRLALQSTVISSQQANLKLQHARTASDVTVTGGVRFFREGRDAAFVAGLSMPLPSRHTNQGNIRSARASLAMAEESTRIIELDLQIAFDSAWQDLQSAHTSTSALRRQVMPAQIEALAQVQAAHHDGQLPFLEVLKAQHELADLQREILSHDIAFAQAVVRLDALTNSNFPLTQALLDSR